GDRLLEDPTVGVEAHGRDVAVLLRAEQVAGAADLEVPKGDPEPRAERLVTRDRRQALVRLLGELPDGREEEVRERALPAPAHATAELVQLRQTELVRTIDDQCVRV